VIPLVATIVAATAAGFGLEHRLGERADSIGKRVVWVMLWVIGPPVVFFNIASLELSAKVGAGIAYGYAALAVTLAIGYVVGTYVLRLPRPQVGALMVGAGFANTMYLGLPFVAALFGTDALPDAVAYDVVVSTVALFTIGFSVGAAFGTVGERPRDRVVAFFARNPLLWACAAGFAAPAALAPEVAVEASQLAVYALLPLGFFVVGVTLAAEAGESALGFPPLLNPAVATAVALRLAVAPAVVVALSYVLIDVPDAYLSQAAMASAVNGIIVALTYGLDRHLVAAVIAWSTAVVVVAGLVVALL
jgi:malate permease and related proteins